MRAADHGVRDAVRARVGREIEGAVELVALHADQGHQGR